MTDNRFQDQNYHLSHFQEEVDVVCPKCQKKGLTTVNYDEKKAKLICTHCGFCEIKDTILTHMG